MLSSLVAISLPPQADRAQIRAYKDYRLDLRRCPQRAAHQRLDPRIVVEGNTADAGEQPGDVHDIIRRGRQVALDAGFRRIEALLGVLGLELARVRPGDEG